jgi:hypothetical protein
LRATECRTGLDSLSVRPSVAPARRTHSWASALASDSGSSTPRTSSDRSALEVNRRGPGSAGRSAAPASLSGSKEDNDLVDTTCVDGVRNVRGGEHRQLSSNVHEVRYGPAACRLPPGRNASRDARAAPCTCRARERQALAATLRRKVPPVRPATACGYSSSLKLRTQPVRSRHGLQALL